MAVSTRRGFLGAVAATAAIPAAAPSADRVRFLAFADIHYYPGVFPHDTREWLERVLNRAEKSKVDFIIHMGDFTHTPVACRDYVDFYNDFRIKTYHSQTEPLIEYYKKAGKYWEVCVNGGTIEENRARVLAKIETIA